MVQYYFLDGIDKKGPFSKSEIISKNLDLNTLIYFDGLSNWTPLSQFEELMHPIISDNIQTEKTNEIRQANVDKVSKSETVIISSIIILILGLIFTTFFSYIYTVSIKEKDFKIIETKINDVFQGKNEICDYKINDLVKGEFADGAIFPQKDNDRNNLVEYFRRKDGGWCVLALKRLPSGFQFTESYPENMGFKIPETEYVPSNDFGNEGYNSLTNRGTVQNAYTKAMLHLSKENKDNSYVTGSYWNIKTFDDINTDFYYISNVPYKGNSHGSTDKEFYVSWTSYDSSVFNSDWIVWYKTYGKHFEIVERAELFNEKWITYSMVSGFIFILIFILFKYGRRIRLE